MPVLELKNIIKKYPDGQNINEVLKDVSFQVNQGEFAAIVGPSGAGKSTLLTIMGALLTPTSGQILLNGQDISQLSKKKQTEIRLNQIGFIFQNSDLIPYLKIKDQLQFIQKISSKKPVDAIGILDNLGLKSRLNSYPNVLSGGEKQRVAIARAFINQPNLILADEPTASLDSQRGHDAVSIIQQTVHQENKAAVMVTHDERVLDLVDTIWEIEDGKLKKVQ
ncbi:ABC transporter ATP-binding protein [Companilactobacillus pabuli]|jgi:putative ABC transport system ATP-binding protein|uniref:Putative hemin import ATP-binding protein HrtA n=1 Tax=Companilactobacillus pabuli TaxID=2714036 RepID=A0A7L7KYA1_9LACO|nr:ABC transporter ATP-binding protein [Companilactobacillus pabuli]AKP02581.1 hemin ABC transporter ATP-binding protein [Companilactobacillus farciminis]AKS50878.1 hemin ABC transporter ATP-binding protein [Companilactobacillus farciminis]MDG5114008.1 ABC transporter ATP-binding protein [Companilactobacillus pabuli]QMT84761.1 ABC transporter ATP-binding protein [Companilactobacillus pabuli]GAQ02202.1 hemin ABC transporter ATP-binding protein [Companilactobacillus farciminis]